MCVCVCVCVCITKRLQWHKQVYSKKEELNDNAQPSAKFVKFFMFLDELDANVRALSDVNTMQQTLAHLVAAVAAALIDPTGAFWRSAAFERGGLNQFVLDMRFFVYAAGHYANCAASLIEPAVNCAVDDFANNAGVDRTKLLKVTHSLLSLCLNCVYVCVCVCVYVCTLFICVYYIV